MAKLAIKGHSTRGNEVIEILEMLGGKHKIDSEGLKWFNGTNIDLYYTIKEDNYIHIHVGSRKDGYIKFSLEEFLEKYPYKVGDKVCFSDNPHHYLTIMEIWWNDDCSDLECTFYEDNIDVSVSDLYPYKEETMEVSEEFYNKYCVKCGSQRCTAEGEWLKECKYHKEEIMEELRIDFPEGYGYAGIENKQVIFTKIQLQYPKTCEECLKILGKTMNSLDNMRGYKYALFMRLQQLLISREAYWKIAGEQMGLGKPWKPDWEDETEIYYTISYDGVNIKCYNDTDVYSKLAFPTEEMRDAFYENFKELIESCKELL